MKTFILSTTTALACFCVSQAAPKPEPVDPADESTAREIEDEVRQVEDDVREVEVRTKEIDKAMAKAQKAIHAAQAALAIEPLEFSDEFEALEFVPKALAAAQDKIFALAGPARAAAKPLIVRSGDIDPKTQSSIEEDLAVMSRILNKVAGQREGREEHEWAMGIALSSSGSGGRPQSLYLEGYGALFLLNVKYPLVEPPKKEKIEKEEVEDLDSEWEQTKDELFGEREFRRGGPYLKRFSGAEGQRTEYDADRVADLKKNLLEALKNAAKIRTLKPEETITIAVTGSDVRASGPVNIIHRNDGRGKFQRDVVIAKAERAGEGGETHLVIRVKKADVDAFAKGTLKFEDFQKKASITTY